MDPATTTEAVAASSGLFPMFIMMTLCMGLSLVIWLLATYLGPNRPGKTKNASYECGITPSEDVHQRLDIHFYRVSILFLIFGVELLFFFPWAVAMVTSEDRGLRMLALGDMIVFAFILIVGFIFAWKKGGLNWSEQGRRIRNIHGQYDEQDRHAA
ncbi:MAG TPA: NADH-quinone oxidoreductase subunit A [bacterium]|jgi:NADH-quinone oxidoreductase subunit A